MDHRLWWSSVMVKRTGNLQYSDINSKKGKRLYSKSLRTWVVCILDELLKVPSKFKGLGSSSEVDLCGTESVHQLTKGNEVYRVRGWLVTLIAKFPGHEPDQFPENSNRPQYSRKLSILLMTGKLKFSENDWKHFPKIALSRHQKTRHSENWDFGKIFGWVFQDRIKNPKLKSFYWDSV